jgi:hypothetical protein
MMLLWAAWLIGTSVFHKSSILLFRLGEAYTDLGVYFLFRMFIQGPQDIRLVFRTVCILIAPLAAVMLVEKLTGQNPLGVVGFAPATAELRNGYFRAQGAFGHSILAGTLGAVCLPMAACLWREERKVAAVGLAAALAIVYASGSSGPIMTAFCVLAALMFWRVREYLGAVRWLVLFLLIALDLVMNDPVYFLMARIDIAGGSTGYFRAQLIRSAIQHLNEWWLAGTDYTRHWMASGIAVNTDHTDMTNYYIQMGVWGGLPLMLLFMAVLVAGFAAVGHALRRSDLALGGQQFMVWALGCVLFGHATTFISISYFDQSVVFLCLALACVGCLRVVQEVRSPVEADEVTWPNPNYEPESCRSEYQWLRLS